MALHEPNMLTLLCDALVARFFIKPLNGPMDNRSARNLQLKSNGIMLGVVGSKGSRGRRGRRGSRVVGVVRVVAELGAAREMGVVGVIGLYES